MFGMKMPKFGAKSTGTPRPQVLPGIGQPQEQRIQAGPGFGASEANPTVQTAPARPQGPGSRVAQSLMNMQFNRNPQSPLGAFGGALDQMVDAYGEKNWKNKFGYGQEE